MTGSMKAVGDGFIGVNKAADEFGVPRSTLKDKLSGKVAHGARSGPNPYLSGVDYELVKFLFTCTDISIPKARVKAISIVWKAAIKKQGTDKGFNGKGINFWKGTTNFLCVGVSSCPSSFCYCCQ